MCVKFRDDPIIAFLRFVDSVNWTTRLAQRIID